MTKDIYIVIETQFLEHEINAQTNIAVFDNELAAKQAVKGATIRNNKLFSLNNGVEVTYSYNKFTLNHIPEICIIPSKEEIDEVLTQFQNMCFSGYDVDNFTTNN